MSTKQSSKNSQQKKFEALNEFVQIRPIKEERKQGKILLSNVNKEKSAKGEVLSVGLGRHLADGTLVKATVEVGDKVLYNPHMIGYELKEDDGKVSIIISAMAIYGRYR